MRCRRRDTDRPVRVPGSGMDLSLVAELDRLAEPAFRDGAGGAVVQTDPPGRAVGDDPPDALASVRGDPPGQVNSGRP
jgi:hypothetical protein